MMERLSEKRLWQGARMWEKQMPVPTISSGLYRRCCFTQASLWLCCASQLPPTATCMNLGLPDAGELSGVSG
ncbi:MAG: hypothetical protein ACI9TB_000040 [Parasphingorhabdus sp.]|jgi:hypothetical protein